METKCDVVETDINTLPVADPVAFEAEHVHRVYDAIAHHFSSTRYKAWPKVRSFVEGLQKGSFLVDVGCGNGKNLCLSNHVWSVGCDRSSKLIHIAAGQRLEGLISDALRVPFQSNSFDAVLSIAVVHHFTTVERRSSAITELLRLVKPSSGLVLIYVWAKEQPRERGAGSDVLIKWEMHNVFDISESVYHRYYHLFSKGELEQLCSGVTLNGYEVKIEDSYYDKENWCVVLSKQEKKSFNPPTTNTS